MKRIATLILILSAFAGLGYSQMPFSLGGASNITLALNSDRTTAKAGDTVNLVLKMDHAPGWNSYWLNPGTGMPTALTWELPEGYETGTTLWPIPKVKDSELGTNHVYIDIAYIVTPLTIPADAPAGEVTIGLKADWLECDKQGCVPSGGTASVSLQIGDQVVGDPAVKDQAKSVMEQQPQQLSSWQIDVGGTETVFEARLSPGEGANNDPGEIYFFESTASPLLEYELPIVKQDGNDWVLKMPKSEEAPSDGIQGFFYAPNGWETGGSKVKALALGGTGAADSSKAAPIPAPSVAAESSEGSNADSDAAIAEMKSWGVVAVDNVEKKEGTLPLMLMFALVGGIILNFMPCVFPVLGLKIMGFVSQAGDDKAKIRNHGFVFALGVLVSLWVLVGVLLAVRAIGGENVSWGFQLQNPLFLAFMISVMFIFGLNLSGLFEMGTSLTSAGSGLQSKSGYSGSFFSGVLAVLVASPCTGPFMGPAIAFALSSSTIAGLGIFTALGVGLALPYVILSCFPALIDKLPQPGAWMETFKHFMAFPLYATAIWLLWVFGKITGTSGMTWLMFGLLIAAFGMWLYGRYATLMSKPSSKMFGRIAAVAGVAALVFMANKGSNSETPQANYGAVIQKYGLAWEKFSPTKVVEHRKKGRTVFIDFTADW